MISLRCASLFTIATRWAKRHVDIDSYLFGFSVEIVAIIFVKQLPPILQMIIEPAVALLHPMPVSQKLGEERVAVRHVLLRRALGGVRGI